MQPDERHGFREHPIVWDDRKIARLWDYYSRTPGFEGAYFSSIHGARVLRKSTLDLQEHMRVLDFGCGPGYMWEHLRALDARWQYTGLDFSAQSIRKLEERARGDESFVAAHHVTQLPSALPSAGYDVVLLVEVVEHLTQEYLDATLREVARLLTPRGVVVTTLPNDENLAECTKLCPECGAIFHEWQHMRSWTPTSLEAQLRIHGFAPKFVRTLDLGAVGLLGKVVQLSRKWLLGRNASPHMIAVFEKAANE